MSYLRGTDDLCGIEGEEHESAAVLNAGEESGGEGSWRTGRGKST